MYEIFVELLKKHNVTAAQVAKDTGISQSTLSEWKHGNYQPKADKMQKIANYFGVSVSYLIGETETAIPTYDNIIPMPSMTSVPLLGTIACGEPITAVENIEDYVAKPESIDADFALRCKGDSMVDARIFDGDIVYIHQQPTVNNGEIAAVLIDDEATLKRVYVSDGTITLMPANQKYPPLIYSGEQLNNIRILGKAVAFTSVII
ncbi:MAG: helix-turn-helix domain-containing protein [Clostridia bacterium]|nr:helix-turn-helix domain-containing protein [Clostridia bacterium]MBQ5716199.1 helix-turn-helix domain-containing protein [Clostridia bacterium]